MQIQDALIVVLSMAGLVAFMRGVLWLRSIDTDITQRRISSYRIEKISQTRYIVFDGRNHKTDSRPFFEIDIPLDPALNIAPPVTSDGVRWNPVPDLPARRDLLIIVNHSIIKTGDCGLIRAANKCQADGLISETRWQAAINYGVTNYGVVARERDKTQVGFYSRLSRLAEAINNHEIVNPTAPVSA